MDSTRKDTLRIMYASNAPWCTSGYGVQGKSLLPRLKRLPTVDDVACFAWFGLEGGGMTMDGIPIYPRGVDPYGNDMFGAHCDHFKADVLITLIDIWVIRPESIKEIDKCLWAPWLPVDHDPVPQIVVDPVLAADFPITYAKFGQDALRKVGIESHYIPHGIEVTDYLPRPKAEVDAFRKSVCEDAAWLGVMVSANKGWPSRKGLVEALQAFKLALPQLPQPAILYIHTDYTKVMGGGDLAGLVKSMGLQDNVRFPNRYKLWIGEYTPRYLSMFYNAADMLLCPSKGEGFGIPIIEAQACGAPVVVTNFSSMPELVRWGVAVDPERLDWTYQSSWQAVPDVPGVAAAILELTEERASLSPSKLTEKRMFTSQAIHQEFSWDNLVDQYWQPLMDDFLQKVNDRR
jgi:glycosyltransferase involved in cell wall biosynthesis